MMTPHMLTPLDLALASRSLGACIQIGDLTDLRDLLAEAPRPDVVAWLLDLDSPRSQAEQWSGFAWAPGGYMLAGAKAFDDRLTTDRLYRPKVPEQRWSALARRAFQLLRAGVTGRELLAVLDAENARFVTPLPAHDIGRVALWCARRHGEAGNAS